MVKGVFYLGQAWPLDRAELAFTMVSTTREERDPLISHCVRSSSSKSAVMSSTVNLGNQAPTMTDEEAPGPEERCMSSRVNRKMDIALLPFLSLLYLFNGLDRSNVGNAETQGMFRSIRSTPLC